MAYIPFAPRIDGKYTLVAPSGVIATFNDPNDANYVGMLTDVTGLDSPEVRENAEDKVMEDGGVHGTFFYGRRPITLSGTIFGHSTVAQREARWDRLARASNALRADATLRWSYAGIDQYCLVRRQQPTRQAGGWVKEFQVALVAADARIYSDTNGSGGAGPRTSATAAGVTPRSLTVENVGSDERAPILVRITANSGTVNDPVVTNTTTGKSFTLTGTIPAGETWEIDVLNRTAKRVSDNASRNSYINRLASTWPFMKSGNNTYTLTYAGGGTSTLTLVWRDSWV